jgi:hypothetical protein
MKANAVARLNVSDKFGSRAVHCHLSALELHLDLTKDLRVQCALPAQSSNREPVRSALGRPRTL